MNLAIDVKPSLLDMWKEEDRSPGEEGLLSSFIYLFNLSETANKKLL